ncbi:uncharacterized protein FIESC28_09182 [Fusarium coffeatum]|uniref:Uncharacterized protein n=1 Tax=Fusarium coffeatum TaxID=231269 RepID=A0A366R1V8_9HYPO|nr:uncharacterized protein FIESC28_09182 [Fusarium coffeatum]RBR11111.1 hypothetical protein FIESC28_09182 [Fusarium coffeatum]
MDMQQDKPSEREIHPPKRKHDDLVQSSSSEADGKKNKSYSWRELLEYTKHRRMQESSDEEHEPVENISQPLPFHPETVPSRPSLPHQDRVHSAKVPDGDSGNEDDIPFRDAATGSEEGDKETLDNAVDGASDSEKWVSSDDEQKSNVSSN